MQALQNNGTEALSATASAMNLLGEKGSSEAKMSRDALLNVEGQGVTKSIAADSVSGSKRRADFAGISIIPGPPF